MQHDPSIARRAEQERLWLQRPEALYPENNSLSKSITDQWSQRISPLILPQMRMADLGIIEGGVAQVLLARGALIDGVETASTAIRSYRKKYGEQEGLSLSRGDLPHTALKSGEYDLVFSGNLIGRLDRREQRLLISEMARLCKPSGRIVIGSALDSSTDGALHMFDKLIRTEISPIQWQYNYHSLYCGTLERLPLMWHRGVLSSLEKICAFFSPIRGISHVLMIGEKRPFQLFPDSNL